MEIELHSLFPTAVVSILDPSFSLTEKERDVIWNYRLDNDNNYHNCHASYSGRILEDRKLRRFKKYLQGHLEAYVSDIMKCDNKIKITNSWGNYSHTGNCHRLHQHSNSILSGIYYLQVEDSVPLLEFEKTNRYFLEYRRREETSFNSSNYTINLKDGMLVIFPSNLTHSVPVNTSNKWRISVAFNSFLLGQIDCGGYEELNIKDA
jgi:uncharacterized protein (TIGR02466 family)|tara:strand:- start:88 stop:705 length:618 start_codon:yes stop_codon:yes gene_type:complete